jgi:hypothetical protein
LNRSAVLESKPYLQHRAKNTLTCPLLASEDGLG